MGDGSLEEEQRTVAEKRTTKEPVLRSFNVFLPLNEKQVKITKDRKATFPQGNLAGPSHLAFMEYDLLCCRVYREVRG